MSLFLLDTSALAAHLFREEGWVAVDGLFRAGEDVAVCGLSLFELHFLLKSRGMSSADVGRTMAIYEEVFHDALPVDAAVVRGAIRARERSAGRLPLADAMVAGCAWVHSATLVCKDAHFLGLPESLVRQMRLPETRP